jgi:hypothetical protein
MSTPKNPAPESAPESAVDMDFRPAHYSDFLNPMEAMVNGIAGQMRRDVTRCRVTDDMVRVVYEMSHSADGPPPLEEKVDQGYIRSMNRFHGPHWLGGEYLPDLNAGEIEIARIVLASVLCDVLSIRARWVGGRYHYRILDEYETVFTHRRKTSKRTLTLAQIIELIQSADGDQWETGERGLVECWWEQEWDYGSEPRACTRFAKVESEIYLGMPDYYRLRAREWEAEKGWEE